MFERQPIGENDFLVHRPTWDLGVRHGFSVGPLPSLDGLSSSLCSSRLMLPNQTHGTEFIDLTKYPGQELDKCNGDAIVGFRLLRPGVGSSLIGIRTADCVPIIMMGPERVAVVHAGWRGLAGGILEQVLDHFPGFTTALIGPCARECCYEIGAEVITKIGSNASVRSDGTSLYLSTGQTASNIINILGAGSISVADCHICTICNSEFSSYRRDRTSMRNITFCEIQNPRKSDS